MQILDRSEMKNIMAGSGQCSGGVCQCDLVYGCYLLECDNHSDPQGCMDETLELYSQCNSDCKRWGVA